MAFYTLGCKLNFSETSTIVREFQNRGFEKVDFGSPADYYIINTCSVTALADKKCRNVIRRASKISPNSKIIAVGCYAQLNPAEIEKINGVDLILGTDERFKIFDYLDEEKNGQPVVATMPVENARQFNEAFSLNERTRSFLKVQDGCDYLCAYCTVPLARGRSRNTPVKKLVGMAREIAGNGVKEIVLTGVNIGDFGKSTGENFLQLIQELDDVDEIGRFRISSIEPNLLTDGIIEFINQSKKFVPHFHIPLQSGCNKILKLMKRRYNRELFENRLGKIKSLNPLACIGVDVITGFPGETDGDFDETYSFLEKLGFSYLHVFVFSERKNTLAATMKEKIPKPTKDWRSEQLIKLSDAKSRDFYASNLGKTSNVIFESITKNNKINGFTDNYIKVETNYQEGLENSMKWCELTGIDNDNIMNIKILKDYES